MRSGGTAPFPSQSWRPSGGAPSSRVMEMREEFSLHPGRPFVVLDVESLFTMNFEYRWIFSTRPIAHLFISFIVPSGYLVLLWLLAKLTLSR